MTALPLDVVEDGAGRDDPWRSPSFVRGTEQPLLERDENLLVRITDCTVLLETREAPAQPWQLAWCSYRPGQATVTDRRVVVGCRRYRRGAGRALLGPALAVIARSTGIAWRGRCMGGHFRYEWVSDLALRQRGAEIGSVRTPSHLMLTASEADGRQWRLTIGSVPASAYLPDLAALVANQVAHAHRRGAGRETYLDADTELAVVQGWPPLRPEPGCTGSAHIPGACPLGTRPYGVGAHAWRA